MMFAKHARRWRLILVIPAFALVLPAAQGELLPSAPPEDRRPNVVVVMTDDQDLDSVRFMPRLQRLVTQKGLTFTNNTVAYSLCCPSRATFLSGQFNHNNGVQSNGPPDGGYDRLNPNETIPVWLQRAGYATGHVGKYPNGYDLASHPSTQGVPPGWTDWRGSPEETAYSYYNYIMNENGQLVSYGNDESDYQTDVFTRLGAQFIRDRSAKGEPFFLNLAYVAPHWEFIPGGPGNLNAPRTDGNFEGLNAPPEPAARHEGMFAGTSAPRPPSFNEENMEDKPAFFQGQRELTQDAIDEIDQWYRARVESLQAVDEGIEQLINTLAETKELNNTVFIFTSDNGWFQGEHRLSMGKIHVYEPSTRVPLIVRGPGVAENATVADWTSNVDLASTILDLAKATPGLPQDGMSLVPYLGFPDTHVGRVVLHETTFPNGGYKAVRAGRWKYVEYATGERELYDLEADPHELSSIHADTNTAGVQSQLAEFIARLKGCSGPPCVVTGYTGSP